MCFFTIAPHRSPSFFRPGLCSSCTSPGSGLPKSSITWKWHVIGSLRRRISGGFGGAASSGSCFRGGWHSVKKSGYVSSSAGLAGTSGHGTGPLRLRPPLSFSASSSALGGAFSW